MANGYLCIGGPHDGERFESQKSLGFSVPVLTEPLAASGDVAAKMAPLHKVIDYRLEVFSTPHGDINLWTPTNQTPLETMNLLLKSYEEAAKYWRSIERR